MFLKNIFKEICYLKHKLEFLQNIVQLYALFIISYFLSVNYLSIDHSDSTFQGNYLSVNGLMIYLKLKFLLDLFNYYLLDLIGILTYKGKFVSYVKQHVRLEACVELQCK